MADAASPPAPKAAKAPEMAWWTPEELSRVLDLVADEEQFPLYRFTAILRAHRAGAGYQDHDLVFCHPDGEPLHPEAVSKTFERRVRRSGLPYVRLHDLRHTHAAHLVAAGQDALVIAKRLGHASVSFTYDKYGHLMGEGRLRCGNGRRRADRRSPCMTAQGPVGLRLASEA